MELKATNDSTQQRTFCTLEEIESYKDEVRQSIHDDEKRIGKLWSDLFHKEDTCSENDKHGKHWVGSYRRADSRMEALP